MKKYLLIIIVMLSIITSYFLYNQYNERLYVQYFNFQDYIGVIEEKETVPLFLNINNNDKQSMQSFFEKLIDFSKNKYTFTFVYKKQNNTTTTSCFALYTENEHITNKIRNCEGIDFSKIDDKGYYSSNLDDKNARNNITILDNNIFNQQERQIEIVSLGSAIEDISSMNVPLSLYFYTDDVKSFDTEFRDFLKNKELDDNITFDNFYNDYYPAQLEAGQNNMTNELSSLIFYVAIVYIVFLMMYLSKKRKAILIQKLHGISYVRIIFKEFMTMFCLHTIIFIIFFIGIMGFLINWHFTGEDILIEKMLYLILCVLLAFVIMTSIIYAMMRLFISIKNLKRSSYSAKNIIYVITVKMLILLLISVPMIEIIKSSYQYGMAYYYINKQYDTLSSKSYIDNDVYSEDADKIYDYYFKKGAIYCDFQTYQNNTLESLIETFGEDIDEERLNEQALDFPTIYVNANYIEAMGKNIYKKNGQKIDLSSLDKDKLLVPSCYMSKRLENALIFGSHSQGEIEIIEIKNTGQFLNYGINEPYTLSNPVIYLVTQRSAQSHNECLYLTYFDELLNEIQTMTKDHVVLISCKKNLDLKIIEIKNYFFEYGFMTLLYLSIYISLLYQSVFWFMEEFKKLLIIEYLFGKSKLERYGQLFVLNGVTYIILLIYYIFQNVILSEVIKLYSISLLFEILVMLLIIKQVESKNVGIILKGENEI